MTFSADFCILHGFAAGSAKNAPPRSAERHREPNIQRSLVQKGVSAAFLLSQLAAHQHCLGDSSGWTRGLMMASVMGVLMGRKLAEKEGC